MSQTIQQGYARQGSRMMWRSFGAGVAAFEMVLIAAVSLACGISYHLVAYGSTGELGYHLSVGVVAGAVFVTVAVLQGHHRLAAYLAPTASLKRPFAVWTMTVLYTLAIGFLWKVNGVSRGSIVVFWLVGLVVMAAWRTGLTYYVARASRFGRISARRVLLIGSREAIDDFAIRYQPWNLGFQIVGQAILNGEPELEEFDLDSAARMGRRLQPDDVFVLLPWSETGLIERIVDRFLTVPVAIHLGPEHILDRFRQVEIQKVSGMSTMCLVRKPLSPIGVMAKRVLDVTVAVLALVALAPLFLVTAFLIWREDGGPVLFRQRRFGFNREPFTILKFRTMSVQPETTEVAQARRHDPRVTRIGRYLRRFNIDELPQLVNVLKGDMSIVGPRPHAVPHDLEFEGRVSLYARRHNVKPGITGWAQVNGFRGETDTDEKLKHRVAFDLYYIDNWSLGLDIQIMGRTILSPKAYSNAY